MAMEELAESPVGQLVPITAHDIPQARASEHVAFLPEPLPEDVELSQATWRVIVPAMQALARLDQAGVLVPNPGLLRAPLLRREAVSTSALEGTHAMLTDVLEADVSDDRPRSPELQEVHNYVVAAEHGIDAVMQGRQLGVGLLREVHQLLVRGTRSDGPDAGRVRSTQVFIGPQGGLVDDARFVPPPPDDRLQSGVRAWEQWVATRRDLPVVAQAAMAHYQFETLHPFHVGNGRIGRLVIVLQLLESGELRQPLLEVSPWFEARRRDYQDHLFQVSRTGLWDPWVRFFSEAIRAQATRTSQRIDELLRHQAMVRDLLRSSGVRGVALEIAEGLIGSPVVTPTWAARTYGVTYPAANAAIKRLLGLNLLTEVTGRSYARLFTSSEVMAILER